MRWLPPIFLLGILLNVALCLVFRLRVDRRSAERFEVLRDRALSGITSLTTNALYSIDQHFLSNKVAFAHSPPKPESAAKSKEPDEDFPLLRNAGSWKYHYFEIGNNRFARVGIRNYGEGDFFPRGGLISNIHPDGVVIDGKYWVSNLTAPVEGREESKTDLQSLKELNK